MSNEKQLTFIAFYDEDNIKREGYFEVLINNGIFIKFKTSSGNVLTIPYNRLLKIKEKEVQNG